MKSNIMKTAWAIRKSAAAKFGCPVMEIDFSACLRNAWAEARKGENKMDINTIVTHMENNNFQCSIWEKYGKTRIYLKYQGQNRMKDAGYIYKNDNDEWGYSQYVSDYNNKLAASCCREIGINN